MPPEPTRRIDLNSDRKDLAGPAIGGDLISGAYGSRDLGGGMQVLVRF